MASLGGERQRVFWSSLVWGRTVSGGSAATDVSRLFFELGMIHVLVLSGSQVASYFRLHDIVLGLSLRALGVSRSSLAARIGIFLSWLSLAIYVVATGTSAPLVRSFVVLAVSESGILRKTFEKILLSLVLHIGLFPQHLGTLSFVLSWGAFLLLVLMAEFGVPRLAGLAILCLSSHLLVVFVKGAEGVESLGIKALLANLALVPLFEGIVFPMGSLLAFAAIAMSSLGLGFQGECWRRIFDCGLGVHDIIAQVFLGALKGIRYI